MTRVRHSSLPGLLICVLDYLW